MRKLASDYPAFFTAIVFGTAAFLGSLVVAGFYILILINRGLIASPSGDPFDAYLFLYILLLPGLTTAFVGSFAGRRLLERESEGRFQSAGVGAGIAGMGFLLWLLEGVLLWMWIDFPPATPTESTVNDLLTVLGYALMAIVFVVATTLGGLLGMGLRAWLQREPPEGPAQEGFGTANS